MWINMKGKFMVSDLHCIADCGIDFITRAMSSICLHVHWHYMHSCTWWTILRRMVHCAWIGPLLWSIGVANYFLLSNLRYIHTNHSLNNNLWSHKKTQFLHSSTSLMWFTVSLLIQMTRNVEKRFWMKVFLDFSSYSCLANLSMPSQHRHLFFKRHIRRIIFLMTLFAAKLQSILQTCMESHFMRLLSGFQRLCHDGGSRVLQEGEIKSVRHGLRVSKRIIGIHPLSG